MPINPEAVGNAGDPADFSWTSTDSLLYALGVGAGADDPTGSELEFTTENSIGITQRALPTQGVVMGGGGFPDFGDYELANLLHAEQSITLHQEIPAEGRGTSQSTVAGIYDKGKAALVIVEGEARDADRNLLWTTRAGLFISGEGGWGGDRGPANAWELPDREADEVVTYHTRIDQALLYRLNGDRNPLHSDPEFARRAGFPQPILHGLCTFGFTGRALLHAVCEGDPARFKNFGGRFKSPVMPGEQLDVHIWADDGEAKYQTRVGDRVVLDQGVCRYE